MIDMTIEIRSIDKASLVDAVFNLFIQLQKDRIKEKDMLSTEKYDINVFTREV